MPDAYFGHGGIAQYNRDFIRACLGSSNYVSMVSLTRLAARSSEPFPSRLTEIPCPGNKVLYLLRSLYHVYRIKPSLIICGHLNLLPVAAILKRLAKVPIIAELYGVEAWNITRPSIKRNLSSVKLFLSISRFTKAKFSATATIQQERIRVLPNCIDTRRFRIDVTKEFLRQKHGIGNNKVLLTVGRLVGSEAQKGHDRILSALRDLISEFGDFIYIIIGDGDDRERLETMTRSYGLTENVRFLGKTDQRTLVEHYHLADGFAMPSLQEGFGFVFLEALACGLPVLAGNQDGSVDALQDGALGILVNPNDSTELRNGLRQLFVSGGSTVSGLDRFSFTRFAVYVHRILSPYQEQEHERK